MKKRPSIFKLLFTLGLLFIICMSPVYLVNVYSSSKILLNRHKYQLKRVKIDTIYSTSSSHGPNEFGRRYNILFNDKKEKLTILIIDKNVSSFSKRTKDVCKDFEKNILKENGWLGRSSSDSMNIWQGPSSNLYALKGETELDVTSYCNNLIFNSLLIIITFMGVRYLVKYRKNKKRK